MLIIGHRGDRQKFGDNTIEGVESAFERGADGVEIDVYYDDNIGLYLTHQYLHDKKKPYPLLNDALGAFAKRGRFQIEIKTPEVMAVKKVAQAIKQFKVSDYEITSSIFPLVKCIRELFPKGKVGLLAHPLIQEWWTDEFGDYFLTNYLKLTGADGIHVGQPEDFWNKRRVDGFHKKGYRVCAHLSTHKKEEYSDLVSYNIDSCTADDLDVLKWRK